MKRLFLAAFLAAGFTATAQEQPRFKTLLYPVKPGTLFKADTTIDRYRQLQGMIQQRSLLPQAQFSHNTSKGKVYTLPIDNMPCLVPDMNQVNSMPGQYNFPDSRMPNALPKQPVIPQEKKEEKKK